MECTRSPVRARLAPFFAAKSRLGGLAQTNAALQPSKDTAPLPARGMNGFPKAVVLCGRDDAPVQSQLLGDGSVGRFPAM